MRKAAWLLIAALAWTCAFPGICRAEAPWQVWDVVDGEGRLITQVAEEPGDGDVYIAGDNAVYEVRSVSGMQALAERTGTAELPALDWLDADTALPVTAMTRRIGLYCTHSDESYEPSDGYYTTNGRGSVYEVASALAEALAGRGVEAAVADAIHHPHDAGAYRRSRQTAVALLRSNTPDCLIDVHRDGIPDPASYQTEIGGRAASKIRLLVGRGNQNAAANKEFALLVKAVADRVYPGLIKDIYMGRGVFNQDLLPRSILLECGTYTLEKERVLRSMPMMADVLQRALYGGVVGSAGGLVIGAAPRSSSGGVTQGQPDPVPAAEERSALSGGAFVGVLLAAGLIGLAVLSSGSVRGGMRKAGRNLREMTGGLIGRKPGPGEEHDHS